MKSFRFLTLALLILALVFNFAACGKESPAGTAATTEAVTAAAETDPVTEAVTAAATDAATEPATEAVTAAAATDPVTEAVTTAAATEPATEPVTDPATEPATEAAEPKIVIRLAELGDAVRIHTDLQAAYLSDSDVYSVLEYADQEGTVELGRPVPITLSWTVETLDEVGVRSFVVRVATNPKLTRPKSTVLPKTKNSLEFCNAMIGTTYYWNVTVNGTDGVAYVSPTASFTTEAQGPRNLSVDGVTNVRDLGGWATEDGGRVRQGKLYRGGRLVENGSASNVLITEDGIKTLRDELGVRSEIDLRLKSKLGGLTASPLGDKVNFYSRPMSDDWSVMFSSEENFQSIREIFALLADESNYPVYFHCSIGTDRTGLIAWLVNGLCGVSEEDLWRDYLFSNFGKINNTRTTGIRKVYVNKLEAAEGATFAEKIYNYLRDTVGVAESDLQAVIGILKEPAAN